MKIEVGKRLYMVDGRILIIKRLRVYIRKNGHTEVIATVKDQETGEYLEYNQNLLHALQKRAQISTLPMAAHKKEES